MRVKTFRMHSLAFKQAAVQQSIDSPNTVTSVAQALGIHPGLLSRWRVQMASESDKQAHMPVSKEEPKRSYAEVERENRKLKKQIERFELETEILKKAQQYFDKKLK